MKTNNTISISSARAGAGKTTSNNKQLMQIHAAGETALVVTPSIKLQSVYNSVCAVNSDNQESVGSSILSAFKRNESFAVTSVACTNLIDYKQQRAFTKKMHCIIDEALDVVNAIELKGESKGHIEVDYRLDQIITFTQNHEGYFDLKFRDSFTNTAGLSKELLSIFDDNWVHTVTAADAEKLKNNQLDGVTIYKRFKFENMNFKTMHIAAANFEVTFMHALLKKLGYQLNNMHGFDGHSNFSKTIRIHYPVIQKVDNAGKPTTEPKLLNGSKTSKEKYMQGFNQYAAQFSHKEHIALRNKSEGSSSVNEIEVKKNCHGQNDYRHLDTIVISAAYNPDKEMARYIRTYFGMTDAEIKNAFATYVFYQAIMRLNIRETDPSKHKDTDIIMYDAVSAMQLKEHYFSCVENVELIPFVINETAVKKVKTKTAKTPAERMREMRERQRAEKQSSLQQVK